MKFLCTFFLAIAALPQTTPPATPAPASNPPVSKPANDESRELSDAISEAGTSPVDFTRALEKASGQVSELSAPQ